MLHLEWTEGPEGRFGRRDSTYQAPDFRSVGRKWLRLRLFQHDLGGFDNRGNGVADFELHFLRASPSDYAFDQILANADDHMGHYPAKLDFDDLPSRRLRADRVIARGYFYGSVLV